MKTGMLWFDADTRRAFDEKVERAVDYYRQKYGDTPDLCLVMICPPKNCTRRSVTI